MGLQLLCQRKSTNMRLQSCTVKHVNRHTWTTSVRHDPQGLWSLWLSRKTTTWEDGRLSDGGSRCYLAFLLGLSSRFDLKMPDCQGGTERGHREGSVKARCRGLWLVSSMLPLPPARLVTHHHPAFSTIHFGKFMLAAVPFLVWSHARPAVRSQWELGAKGGFILSTEKTMFAYSSREFGGSVVVLGLEGLSCSDWLRL